MFNVNWSDIQPYMDKIGYAIQKIGEGIGVAAAHVYGVLVRQEMTIGALEITVPIVWWITYVRVYKKLWQKSEDDGGARSDWRVGFWLWTTFGGAASFVALGFCIDGIMHLINPEYYAMQDILNFLKTLKQ